MLYYFENGKIVFTPQYHIQRGVCCGSRCRHCPFEPKHEKGNVNISNKLIEDEDPRPTRSETC